MNLKSKTSYLFDSIILLCNKFQRFSLFLLHSLPPSSPTETHFPHDPLPVFFPSVHVWPLSLAGVASWAGVGGYFLVMDKFPVSTSWKEMISLLLSNINRHWFQKGMWSILIPPPIYDSMLMNPIFVGLVQTATAIVSSSVQQQCLFQKTLLAAHPPIHSSYILSDPSSEMVPEP